MQLIVLRRCDRSRIWWYSRVRALTCGLAVGKSRDALYENVLAENEREAVADLLQYLENVSTTHRASIRVARHR
jgi:hypothetical protein